MLCEITIPANFDERSKERAWLQAIQAVATAAVNTTPSAVAYPVYNDILNGVEIITRVVDNSIAGSWTAHPTYNRVPATGEATNSMFNINLALYQSSGKTNAAFTHSFFQITSFPNAPTSNLILSQVLPWVRWGVTNLTTMNPTNSAVNTGFPDYFVNHNSRKSSSQIGMIPNHTNDEANSAAGSFLAFAHEARLSRFFVSAGPGYITIAMQSRLTSDTASRGAVYGGGYIHWGLRTNHAWEDARNDNPYWVAVWTKASNSPTQNAYGGAWSIMSLLQNSNGGTTTSTLFKWCNFGLTAALNRNPVTGQWSSTSTISTSGTQSTQFDNPYHRKYAYFNNATTNIAMPLTSNLQNILAATTNVAGNSLIYNDSTYGFGSPFYDSTYSWPGSNGAAMPLKQFGRDPLTTAAVPSVSPVMIEAATNNGALSNTGNYLTNMFFGGSMTATDFRDNITLYAVYEINGEYYLPVGVGITGSDTTFGDVIWIKA